MADKSDEVFALEAKLAIAKGEKVTAEQKSAAKQYDQQLIDEFLVSCPRGRYVSMIGRQLKALSDLQAYDFPAIPEENIDIVKVLKWFHDYLAKWGQRVKYNQLAIEEEAEKQQKKLDLELQKLQAQVEQIRTRNSSLLSTEEVRKTLAWLSSEWRKLGERLGKRFGTEAQVVVNETLERLEKSLVEDLS